ncbi:hypothetical protein FRACA_3070005 [Frankia canadensis]|uniref:Uncharacterized protein n=1 Tax=Frankia canadensis TaxID=1836972 RepID=A0A2I2KU64_9ACTN|nr:hypothetical protein FRACA_3070005 [Frankia canadensis]SOU56497.1 hypothetical protein FRACA_3070005 [Frankia canadensis]
MGERPIRHRRWRRAVRVVLAIVSRAGRHPHLVMAMLPSVDGLCTPGAGGGVGGTTSAAAV